MISFVANPRKLTPTKIIETTIFIFFHFYKAICFFKLLQKIPVSMVYSVVLNVCKPQKYPGLLRSYMLTGK